MSSTVLETSQFSSVAQLCPTLCDPMDCNPPGFPVHLQLPEPAQTHVHELMVPSNHLILWCLLFLLPLIFPSIGFFPMSQFFASGGQNIGVSASASVLPMNIQDWFLLGLTGWISLQCKGLWRVFSNTTVQKYQFFSTWLSLWFYIHYLMYVGSYIHCVEGDFRIHCLILTATLR